MVKMRCLSIALTVLSFSIGTISCGKEYNHHKATRFRDVAEALNHMYENLPAQMTMDDKCRRYALLSFIALSDRFPYVKTVLDVISMGEDEVNKQYEEMDVNSVIYVLVSAIDRYRITQLAPAFIDIIECLRRIETPVVKGYLNQHELIIILDLYKQVLGIPGTRIDVDRLNLTLLSKASRISLRNLFREHFERFGSSSSTVAESHISSQPQDQQSRRQRFQSQRRERSRLEQQRLRFMDEKFINKYREERRRWAKKREQSVLPQPSDTPEVIEIKRKVLEKRAKQNRRERLRRQKLREIKCQQEEELDAALDDEFKGTLQLYKTGRFKDIAQAVSFLKENLPANVSIEEQCKKYAVLSDIALLKKFPYQQTVLDVARMGVDTLNEYYDKLPHDRISYSYMGVVDRYRVTQLAPALIDLIECLKWIDTPSARTYLSNQEINLIAHVYKQVLEDPGRKIDQISLDLHRFRPEFQKSFEKLFKEHLKAHDTTSDSSADPNTASHQVGPSTASVPTNSQQQQLEEQPHDLELQRQQVLDRRREMARLLQKRRNLMHPDLQKQDRSARKARREVLKRSRALTGQSSDNDVRRRREPPDPQGRQVGKRRQRYRQLSELPLEQPSEQLAHSNPAQVMQTTDRQPREQQSSQLQERRLGLEVPSHQLRAPQELSLFPVRPVEGFAMELRRVEPSSPRQVQLRNSASASSPSTFLHVLRALLSEDRRDRDQLFDDQSLAITDQVVRSHDIYPVRLGDLSLEERPSQQDFLNDLTGTDAITQYLSSRPQGTEAAVDVSPSISAENRSRLAP